MSGDPKIAAILVADVVGYSRLAGADEDRTLSRLRGLRSDLIDPAIAAHHGRVVKRTGDGSLIEFRSVVDAVRCAIEVQNGLIERNAGLPAERRIEFRVGIHLGDVVEEADGDLMGDGVNIAARLEGIAEPGAICLSEDAYRQVSDRLDKEFTDLGDAAQEYRKLDPGLFAADRRPRPSEACDRGEAPAARAAALENAFAALAPSLGSGAGISLALIGPRLSRIGSSAERTPRRRSRASFHRRAALHKSLRRSCQDYFADGITENLTTELSRIRDSFVIARNTAFTFKGKNVDAKEIGKELGVRYVLEGSVQRDQNRVRVIAQLMDAASGAHLWADASRTTLPTCSSCKDEMVARLAQCVGHRTCPGGGAKRRRSKTPTHRSRHARQAAMNQGSSIR